MTIGPIQLFISYWRAPCTCSPLVCWKRTLHIPRYCRQRCNDRYKKLNIALCRRLGHPRSLFRLFSFFLHSFTEYNRRLRWNWNSNRKSKIQGRWPHHRGPILTVKRCLGKSHFHQCYPLFDGKLEIKACYELSLSNIFLWFL